MTRIHQQSSSGQHERFGIRGVQEARRAIWVFAVLALLDAVGDGAIHEPAEWQRFPTRLARVLPARRLL